MYWLARIDFGKGKTLNVISTKEGFATLG